MERRRTTGEQRQNNDSNKETARRFNVVGMACAACVARVEKAVSRVPGVETVAVGLLTNSMSVEGTATSEDVVQAVEKAGYGASPVGADSFETATRSNSDALRDRETSASRRRSIVSLVFLAPLFYFSTGVSAFAWPSPKFLANPGSLGLTQLLLSGAILFVYRSIFRNGFASLVRRAPDMDALVAIGAGASFVFSVGALFSALDALANGDASRAAASAGDFYFESAATILVFIGVGKTLEAYSRGKTTSALKALLKLTPPTATVVRDGREETVLVERVKKGDVFVVRPGESVPVDGVVLAGESAVDESALTGESVPVDKKPGDSTSAGTLNASGFLRCEATRVGEDTTLAQIVRLTTDAATTKAPVARLADKIANFFVPATFSIAAATIGVWLAVGETVGFALARGISVLVISCPCALGLATPAAIVVGAGVGARRGLLFKTAVALENVGKTAIVALDKTGVVTEGRPIATDVVAAPDASEEELISVAVSLEASSEHPLAKAVVELANERNVAPKSLENFQAVAGNGLTGTFDGAVWAGGKLDFIERFADVPARLVDVADALADDGKTPLYFANDGRALGVVAVADAVRNDAPAAVASLKNLGVRVAMLTGDVARVANAVGRRAGVDEIRAGLSPIEKERAIREFAASGRVAMVGDGINDAPALTRADVGIAVASGTDVAIDAADVVAMKNRLADVPAAIRLSRATLRNVRENLFWAFFYNVVGIPLAAGVWVPTFGWTLSPAFCALAMSLSSFCVVSNALRLNFFDPDDARRDRRIALKKRLARSAAATSPGEAVRLKNAKKFNVVEKFKINAKNKESKENEITMKKTLKIEGMACEHCEARVKKALEALDSVESADVRFRDGTAVATTSAPFPTTF